MHPPGDTPPPATSPTIACHRGSILLPTPPPADSCSRSCQPFLQRPYISVVLLLPGAPAGSCRASCHRHGCSCQLRSCSPALSCSSAISSRTLRRSRRRCSGTMERAVSSKLCPCSRGRTRCGTSSRGATTIQNLHPPPREWTTGISAPRGRGSGTGRAHFGQSTRTSAAPPEAEEPDAAPHVTRSEEGRDLPGGEPGSRAPRLSCAACSP